MHLPFQDKAEPQSDIAIIGSGAIGRSLAAMLSQSGHRVDLYGRTASIDSILESKEAALCFKMSAEKNYAPTAVRLKSYDEGQGAAYGTVFHTVKAGYLASVIPQTRHLVDPSRSHEIFIQGGVQWWFGHAVGGGLGAVTDPDHIIGTCDADRVMAGMIKFGAQIPPAKPHAVILKSTSPITFGQVDGGTERACAAQSLFNATPVEAGITQSLLPDLWAKAAGSFSMSAFALITGKTLGGMVDDADVFADMVASANTIREAGREMGFDDKTDYADYLKKIAAGKPDHMMSITQDPREHNAIIDMPIAIVARLGLDTGQLQEIACASSVAANNILQRQTVRGRKVEFA